MITNKLTFDPKFNQVVPWSLHPFPENLVKIGPKLSSYNEAKTYVRPISASAQFLPLTVDCSGGSRLGQRGTGPQILPSPPPPFLDTVVLLLVELIGSIVNFAIAVVASQMMRGQAPKYFFLEQPLVDCEQNIGLKAKADLGLN